jgi:hypothetical protein
MDNEQLIFPSVQWVFLQTHIPYTTQTDFLNIDLTITNTFFALLTHTMPQCVLSIIPPSGITVGVTIPNEKDGSRVQITIIGQRTVSISIVRSSICGTGYPLGVTPHRQKSITSLHSHCTVIVLLGGQYWDYQNTVPSNTQVLYIHTNEEHSTVV